MIPAAIFVNKNLHLQKKYLYICSHLLVNRGLLIFTIKHCTAIMPHIFVTEERLPEQEASNSP